MKRMLALLMALALCLPLCACGSKEIPTAEASDEATTSDVENNTTNAEAPIVYQIGDTVGTGIAEFALIGVKSGWYNALNVLWQMGLISEEQISEETTKESLSNEAIEMLKKLEYNNMVVTFSIKNIGKETLDDFVSFDENDGRTRNIAGLLRLNYNNGYIFECESCYEYNSSGVKAYPYLDIEPLAPAVEYHATIEFPEEVLTNTEASLLLEVALPAGDGQTEIFTFAIR